MNQTDINLIRIKAKTIELDVRRDIFFTCTKDQIVANKYLKAAMGW